MDTSALISSLCLGAKAKNALHVMGVRTVADFLAFNIDNICNLPGVGDGTRHKLLSLRRRLQHQLTRCKSSGTVTSVQNEHWHSVKQQLSARTRHGLQHLRIQTIESFLALTREQVLAVRGMGRTCWDEILKFQKGIQRQSLNSSTDFNRTHISSWDAFLAQFSVRTQHGLEKLGITSFEQFVAITREQFLNIKSIGKTSWNEVRE